MIQRLADGAASLDEAEVAELERLIRGFAPTAKLDWMIGLGANAVAAELSEQS